MRDIQTGAITLVNCRQRGALFKRGNNYSGFPDISADGRWVVFSSASSNLVPGITVKATRCFLYDSPSASLVSQTKSGAAANGLSTSPAISDDGKGGCFSSTTSNLVGKAEGFSINEIFIQRRWQDKLEQISVAMNGAMSSFLAQAQQLTGMVPSLHFF